TRNINFVALDSKGLPGPAPVVRACINCTVSPTLPDTTPKPQLLQIVPQVPLTERTRYAAYVTTGLRDASGETVIPSPAFALFRSANRLVDDEGRSTVSVLSDAQAAALEPARAAYQPVFDALQAQGVPRKNLALAWAYTTQSTISTLVELHGAPYAAPGLPSTPLWAADLPIPGGVPRTSIDAAYQGEIVDLFGLVSANATFNPGLQGATPRPLPFVMTVPTGTAPAAGWPVVLFGHGLTGNRTNLLAIANALAARGFVSIAIDEPWHGERNTCTGFGAYLSAAASAPAGTFQDDRACADPATQSCNAVGRCQADTRPVTECAYGTPAANQVCTTAGLGQCAPDGRCEGASFATAVTLGPVSVPVSGWNLLNLANLFALRDNFRQQVISFSQLARVVRDTASPGNLGAVTEATPINPNLVHYAGGSLGGILGTLFTAAAPEISSVVLNVPGADLRTILFTSPAFAPLASGFVAGLEAQGIGRDTPAFDTFINWAKWILDPADPANAAYYTANAATLPAPIASPARRTFVQWIEDDQVIPNPATVALVRAALSRPDATGDRDANVPAGFFDELYSGAEVAAVSACTRHGFLFSPPSAANSCEPGGSIAGGLLTQAAQAQVGLFLSGSAPY
ncbi:MAG TPA: hypothetical protein VEY30_04110, partial [Myxococcaceae bacterium]|nr:hypothetical protein [Myxococcaceae bacterium]